MALSCNKNLKSFVFLLLIWCWFDIEVSDALFISEQNCEELIDEENSTIYQTGIN